jgi:hypothetical protein
MSISNHSNTYITLMFRHVTRRPVIILITNYIFFRLRVEQNTPGRRVVLKKIHNETLKCPQSFEWPLGCFYETFGDKVWVVRMYIQFRYRDKFKLTKVLQVERGAILLFCPGHHTRLIE